jgi:hypothetical protein
MMCPHRRWGVSSSIWLELLARWIGFGQLGLEYVAACIATRNGFQATYGFVLAHRPSRENERWVLCSRGE